MDQPAPATIIKHEDFISSIAESLQFISCYHPLDFITAMAEAYKFEKSNAAKDAIGQIIVNSKMSAIGRRPICQDTGIVSVFVKIGMNCHFDTDMTIQEMVDTGVRRAYSDKTNPLRASILADPSGNRTNTKDNTPAVLYTELVSGNNIEVKIAAKGGGSENKSKSVMLNPGDSIVDWVTKTLPTMGAGWCPPGILGIGIGGTIDKAMILAKESLMDPVNMAELLSREPNNHIEKLRIKIYKAVNNLGIGAQGVGGLTTVLDVKIMDYPTHAASLPVAMIPNCAATRHTHFTLDGTGPAEFTPPDINQWPQIDWQPSKDVKKVNIDNITKEEISTWKAGETILLNGTFLTGRDAAHRRIQDLLSKGESLPDGVDFKGKMIYYVGPVDPVGNEIMGPAGPTTSTRMDKYTDMMLEKTGLIGMIGKSERGDKTIAAIKKHGTVYLMAVGGAAYLVSKAIKKAKVVAFEDLGMEAVYEFTVEDMPVTVAVDSSGQSVHKTGPEIWRKNDNE